MATPSVRRLVPPGIVLAILTGVLAGLGQHEAVRAAVSFDPELYSLPLHVMAMTGVGLLAIVTAARLSRPLALATLLGAAAGPMTLLAAPVSGSLVREDGRDTTLVWHGLAGAVVLGILLWGSWTSVRADLDGPPSGERAFEGSPYLVAAAFGLAAQVPMMGDPERPQLLVAAGWSLLAAGGVVAGLRMTGRQVLGATLARGAVLALMAVAYLRIGGWPGVAGWEIIQPPVILTSVSAGALAAGPLLGFLLAGTPRSARRLDGDRAVPLPP